MAQRKSDDTELETTKVDYQRVPLDDNDAISEDKEDAEKTDEAKGSEEIVDKNYFTECDKQKSSIPQASFNFINSIIGAGIIGIPYAFKQAGFVSGIITIIFVAFATDYSVLLLIQNGFLSNQNTYQDVVRHSFGTPGYILICITQFVFPFSAMIGYSVIVGDTVPKILTRLARTGEDSILNNRRFIILLFTIVIMLPLSLYRNVAKLGKYSFFSLVFVTFIMIVVITRLITLGPQIPVTPSAYKFFNSGIFQAIGVMSFAFVCHHNSYLIYGSLESPTYSRFSKVTHISISYSLMCTLVLGVAGYCTFTGHTQGDLLEGYCEEDDFVNVARLCYSFTVILTYPIECFVAREVIEIAFFHGKSETILRHVLLTLAICAPVLAISLATNCLGFVLELNGSFSGAPLVFIFPGACFIKLAEGPVLSRKKLPALGLVVIGVAVWLFGTIMTFLTPHSCIHSSKHLPWCMSNVTDIFGPPISLVKIGNASIPIGLHTLHP